MKKFISLIKLGLRKIFKFENYFYNININDILENNIVIIFTFLKSIIVVPIALFIIGLPIIFILNIITLINGESKSIETIGTMIGIMMSFLLIYEIPIVAVIWNLFRIKLDKDSLLKNIVSHIFCILYIVPCIAGMSDDIKYGGDIFHSYWAIPVVATLLVPIFRYIFIRRKYKNYNHYKQRLEERANDELKISKKSGDIIYNNILLGVGVSSIPLAISELILATLVNFLGKEFMFIQDNEFYYIVRNVIAIIIMRLIIRYFRQVETKADRIKSIILPIIVLYNSILPILLNRLLFSGSEYPIELGIYIIGYIYIILVIIKKFNYFRKSIA